MMIKACSEMLAGEVYAFHLLLVKLAPVNKFGF